MSNNNQQFELLPVSQEFLEASYQAFLDGRWDDEFCTSPYCSDDEPCGSCVVVVK